MESAAPATGAPAGPTRRRWRIPTSVLVTLAGIALSAWLLPAFTRQWDDRQKARELKAGLLAEIASATARALTSGENLLRAPAPPAQRPAVRPAPRAQQAWSVASLQIESRLRAYLPKTVAGWQTYSFLIDQALNAAANSATFGTLASAQPPVRDEELTPRFGRSAEHAMRVVVRFTRDVRDITGRKVSRSERTFERGLLVGSYQDDVEEALLMLEQRLADELLSSHPAGYSTSARDLLHDLVPLP
jgi:hypothetical protein